jgi:hypothetical protein
MESGWRVGRLKGGMGDGEKTRKRSRALAAPDGSGTGAVYRERVANGAEIAGTGGQLSGRKRVGDGEEGFWLWIESVESVSLTCGRKEVVGKGEVCPPRLGKRAALGPPRPLIGSLTFQGS